MGRPSPCYAAVTRLVQPGCRLAKVTGPSSRCAPRHANEENHAQHQTGEVLADPGSAALSQLGWLLRGKGLQKVKGPLSLRGGW